MARIDKAQVSEAIRLLNVLRREAKLADKVVAKLVGKLERLPQLCEELPSPRYLRQVTEASDELARSLAATHDRQHMSTTRLAGRLVR